MISRYTRPAMAQIWSEENKYSQWLNIEECVIDAYASLGLVEENAYDAFANREEALPFDIEKIKEIEKETRHDVAAFVQYYQDVLDPEIAKWFHFGLTSSDILDTSFALQLLDASDIIMQDLTHMAEVMKQMAQEHKDTIMIGRSHGIHAEPITFGLMLTSWYEETQRNIERLVAAKRGMSFGKISGAVGTYSNISPKIEEFVCEELNLIPDPVSTQIISRDSHAYFFSTLAVIASSLEKFATQIRHLQRTEVAEVQESFTEGQKGSSAMPHKRNPILSENITGLCRMVRSYANPSLESVALWHERDMSHSSVERVVAPDATSILDFALHRFTNVLENLVVNKEKMRENLESSGGLYASQTVMLALIHKGMNREEAYRVVQSLATKAMEEGDKFSELVTHSSEIEQYLNLSELNSIFDPTNSLKNIDYIYHKVYQYSQDVYENVIAKQIAEMSDEDVMNNVNTYFNFAGADGHNMEKLINA